MIGRIAASPQAIVSSSSSTAPGAPFPRSSAPEQLDPLPSSSNQAGEGGEGADLAFDLLGGPGPVDARLGLSILGA